MHTHMHTWSFICTSLSKATEMYNGIKCGRHCSTWDHLVKCFDCIMNMPTTYKSNYKRTLVGHFPFSFVCLQIVHGNRATWLCGCVCFRKAAFLASNVKKKKKPLLHTPMKEVSSHSPLVKWQVFTLLLHFGDKFTLNGLYLNSLCRMTSVMESEHL